MDSGFRVYGLGFWGLGFRVKGLGFMAYGLGFRAQGSYFRVSSIGSRVQNLEFIYGFCVQILEFRVQGFRSRCWVKGSECTAKRSLFTVQIRTHLGEIQAKYVWPSVAIQGQENCVTCCSPGRAITSWNQAHLNLTLITYTLIPNSQTLSPKLQTTSLTAPLEIAEARSCDDESTAPVPRTAAAAERDVIIAYGLGCRVWGLGFVV